jgi:large subunit ribosomal protein L34e
MEYSRINKRQRSVSRAYGGCLSHGAVKDRVLRAFLTEEFKTTKKEGQAK